MCTQSGELVATDEATVFTESLFDTIVMEVGQNDGRFSNPADTDESESVRFSTRPTAFSISSLRSKQVLSAGGSDSPSVLNTDIRYRIHQ